MITADYVNLHNKNLRLRAWTFTTYAITMSYVARILQITKLSSLATIQSHDGLACNLPACWNSHYPSDAKLDLCWPLGRAVHLIATLFRDTEATMGFHIEVVLRSTRDLSADNMIRVGNGSCGKVG